MPRRMSDYLTLELSRPDIIIMKELPTFIKFPPSCMLELENLYLWSPMLLLKSGTALK